VPFGLQLKDSVERKETERTFGSAMDLRETMIVATHPQFVDRGFAHSEFRHTAGRNV
jgi:hypothetical protein